MASSTLGVPSPALLVSNQSQFLFNNKSWRTNKKSSSNQLAAPKPFVDALGLAMVSLCLPSLALEHLEPMAAVLHLHFLTLHSFGFHRPPDWNGLGRIQRTGGQSPWPLSLTHRCIHVYAHRHVLMHTYACM